MNAVEIDAETFAQIFECEDFAPPCDSLLHEDHGSGGASWIARYTSPTKPCGCGRVANPVLYCAPCKDRLIARIGSRVRCLHCLGAYVKETPTSLEALS